MDRLGDLYREHTREAKRQADSETLREAASSSADQVTRKEPGMDIDQIVKE